jgi:hypothetical protein
VWLARPIDCFINRWKQQLGLETRTDVQTFFDLYDADEGRDILSACE